MGSGNGLEIASLSVPLKNHLFDASALPIVFEGEALAGNCVRAGRHCGGAGFDLNQAVLAVPSVVPASVMKQVSIEVVLENLRRFGNEHGIRGSGNQVAVGSRPGFHAGDLDGLVKGGGVADCYFSGEVGAVALDGDRNIAGAGEGDFRGGGGGPGYIKRAGDLPAGVLVESVRRVSGGASVGCRALSVPDAVESIAELLAVDRRSVGPVFVPLGDLPEFVLLVHPIAAVGQRGADALVGVVVPVCMGRHDV